MTHCRIVRAGRGWASGGVSKHNSPAFQSSKFLTTSPTSHAGMCCEAAATHVSTETRSKLAEAYALEPYPSDQQMDKLARALRAPSKACVRTFYQSMHLKAMELCGHG